MAAGRIWAPEQHDYTDWQSGASVRQLTDYRGHSHHLYFTNPGWYDDGRRLLFSSDRENRTNLFSIELASGEITQITDLAPLPPPFEVDFLHAAVDPMRSEAYFWYGRDAMAVDLYSCETRPLWETPDGFRHSMMNCTADGRFVCAGIYEDLSDRIRIDYQRGYVGFSETWEANPDSRVVRIPVNGGATETVHQNNTWIGHVNTSPTQPEVITFCHEGPWQLVDNRIWGMNISTGKVWPVRQREMPHEMVGHEYWLADGEYIGYHGHRRDGGKFFGRVRWDDTDRFEVEFPHETGHIHSNDFRTIVGDAGSVVRLWNWSGERFDGPRILCEHRSSMHIQQTHVHPRFTPDGSQVVYTSDMSGYGNVYLVDVPDFQTLPTLD